MSEGSQVSKVTLCIAYKRQNAVMRIDDAHRKKGHMAIPSRQMS